MANSENTNDPAYRKASRAGLFAGAAASILGLAVNLDAASSDTQVPASAAVVRCEQNLRAGEPCDVSDGVATLNWRNAHLAAQNAKLRSEFNGTAIQLGGLVVMMIGGTGIYLSDRKKLTVASGPAVPGA